MATSSSEIPSLQGKVVTCKEKKGVFQGSSIFCYCCKVSFSPSSWEAHCGGNWHRPWQYIFLEETGLNILYYKNQMHALQASSVIPTKRKPKGIKQTEEKLPKKRIRTGNNEAKELVDSEEDADYSLSDSWRPVTQKPKYQRSKIRKSSSEIGDDYQEIYNSKDSLSPDNSTPLDGLGHADDTKMVLNTPLNSVTITPLISNSSLLSPFMHPHFNTSQEPCSAPYGVVVPPEGDCESTNRVWNSSIPVDESADAIFASAILLANDFLLSWNDDPKKESIQTVEFVHSVLNP